MLILDPSHEKGFCVSTHRHIKFARLSLKSLHVYGLKFAIKVYVFIVTGECNDVFCDESGAIRHDGC